MIYAKPRSIFSWGFDIFYKNRRIAVIDTKWMCEGGDFRFENSRYYLEKEGMFSRTFNLKEHDLVIAYAQKTTALRCFEVFHGTDRYVLKAASPFTRKFILEQNGIQIGAVCPNSMFTRECNIDFPEHIPFAVKLFMFWLVVLMWRRTTRSNAATT